MRPLFLFLAAPALAAGTPAAAQDRSPDVGEDILVEGARDRERQIRDFVAALTPAPFGGQISRFDWAVCPAAVGLAPVQNEAIAARLRRVAEAAGIRVANAGCRPNVLVIVARDKRDLIERMHRAYPGWFGEMWDRQVRRLARAPGPAAAWHVEGLLSADGIPAARDVVTGYYTVEATDVPSRLRAASRPHFLAAVVVVEIGALAGLTTIQLADYAAMRAFARTDPDELGETPPPTILTVLEAPMDSPVPITMTQWDLGFLQALYAAPENRYATQQRSAIRRTLRETLASEAEAAD